MCLAACPYENVIYFNDALNIAQKCTFCAHLLDNGWTEPRCVDVCPTGAFTFGEEEDLKDLIAKAQPLKPGLAHVKPRVYYIGLPKKFIAGALFDQETDQCAKGATVTATNNDTGEKFRATSDSYGDFWLKGLKNGIYTLLIEKPGYLAQKFGLVDVTKKDINVGDIPIWKA
jgi:Fe-S-cluster-containing dehydrogenase component